MVCQPQPPGLRRGELGCGRLPRATKPQVSWYVSANPSGVTTLRNHKDLRRRSMNSAFLASALSPDAGVDGDGSLPEPTPPRRPRRRVTWIIEAIGSDPCAGAGITPSRPRAGGGGQGHASAGPPPGNKLAAVRAAAEPSKIALASLRTGAFEPDGLGPAGFGDRNFVTATHVGGFDFIPPQPDRSVDAEVGLASDRTGGPHAGRVYAVYTREQLNESDDTDVETCYSDDGGATWSSALRVNDD